MNDRPDHTLASLNRFLNMDFLQDLQGMQEQFSKLLHLSIAVIDVAGGLHTEPSSPYCDTFKKSTESGKCNQCIWCAEDDRFIPHTYVPQMNCPLGFEDFEIPIVINEQEVGYIVFGQVYKNIPSTYIEKHPELQDVLSRIPIYSESDRKILLEVASSITKFITQISFSRAIEAENHKLEMVQDVMFQISKESNLQTIFDILHNELPKLVKFDLLGVYFYDPQSKELRKKFAEGYAKEALGEDFKEGEGYAGIVAKEKKKCLIIDDARISDVKIKYKALVDKGLYSFLIVSLSFDEKFIGVIIFARKEISGFKEDVARRVEFLAENISATIWKTGINNVLGEKVEELERLHKIQAELHTGLDEDKELFHILTGLTIKGGLSFNRALLFLKRKENNKDVVCGRLAIGPKDKTDSERIYEDKLWADGNKSFSDFLRVAENEFEKNRSTILFSRLNRATIELVYDLDEKNILTNIINEGTTPLLFKSSTLNGDSFYASLVRNDMAASEFIIAPLIYHRSILGAIYVDNKFTGEPITDEKQYFLNIYLNQAAAVLQKALKLKTERSILIGNICHNVTAKLSQVQSYKDLIIDGVRERSEALDRSSNDFDRCMTALSNLYREMREYNSFKLNKVNGAIALLLPESNFYKSCGVNNSRVKIYSEVLDEQFVCDFTALRNVMEELITNSCKHAGKGSDLEIEIKIKVSTVDKMHLLEIDYSDNGSGISDELREKAFELGVTTSKEGDGTGVGLADIKQKVLAHGGGIAYLRNATKGGAEFRIQIPVSKGEVNNGDI